MPAGNDRDSRIQPVSEGGILGAKLSYEVSHGGLVREAHGEPRSAGVLRQAHAEADMNIHDNTIPT